MRPLVVHLLVGLLGCSSSSGSSAFGAGPPHDAGVADAADDADAMACTFPFSTAQYGSLADIRRHPPCSQGMGARQFPVCGGYVVVGTTGGIDCGSSWVFDAASGALVYFESGCNVQYECWSAVPGGVPDSPLCDAGAPVDLCVSFPEAGAGEAGIDAAEEVTGD